MGKINVLGFDVANLIAAGEVVDRPASVVKELMENALDAGSTAITVEIQNGGVSFIRISDNGCGMEAEDLPVAVLRHATSKIHGAEDLDGIRTLGFRGEALAAIASVSKIRIFSKVREAEYGALMQCEGGSVVSVTETGCANGTTVIVEELFFNVPARRKFLKKDSTETVAVTGVVEKIALSAPQVSVRYIVDGETRFMTAGNGDLFSTVYALFGREIAQRTVAVDRSDGGVRVSGFVSAPDYVRSNRNMENFFINGRYVKSRTAGAAVEQAYVSRIPSEKFPFCVLNLEMNPQAVDVNVHPTKLEVKFSNERLIFDAVYYATLSALEAAAPRPEFRLPKTAAESAGEKSTVSSYGKTSGGEKRFSGNPVAVGASQSSGNFWVEREEARKLFGAFVPVRDFEAVNTEKSQMHIPTPGMRAAAVHAPFPMKPTTSASEKEDSALPSADEPTADNRQEPVFSPPTVQETLHDPASVPNEMAEPKEELPEYVIIGEVYNCYVIVQMEDRILLIDKHAAHERIIFDQLCAHLRERKKSAQVLMFPMEVPMTQAEMQALEDVRENVEAIGFSFRVLENSVQITAIPTEISRDTAPEMLTTLAGRLSSDTGTVESTGMEFFEARLYQASCKAAMKGGRLYSTENIKWLCDRLLRVPKSGESAVKTCPHGRPVAFEIRKSSIERQFSRLL